jgi:hypothetical protein
MLSARQLRPPTITGKADEILRDQRHRAPRALLPGGVGRRIDDNLTHDSPTSVVRIAARNEKPCERLGHPHSSRLGPVTVQVPQCGTHVTAVLHRPGELPGSPPRLLSFIVDPSTVLGQEPALALGSCDPSSVDTSAATCAWCTGSLPRVGDYSGGYRAIRRATPPGSGPQVDHRTPAHRKVSSACERGIERRSWSCEGDRLDVPADHGLPAVPRL